MSFQISISTAHSSLFVGSLGPLRAARELLQIRCLLVQYGSYGHLGLFRLTLIEVK